MQPVHGRVARYGVAVAAIAAALGLRLMLQPWLGSSVPYLQFFPAILLAAWYGGFGPGALANGTVRAHRHVPFPAAGRFRRRRGRRLAVVVLFVSYRCGDRLDQPPASAGGGGAASSRAAGDGPRRAARRHHQHDRRRHHRHRQQREDRGVQPWRGATLRLSGVGGARTQRQHADALALPRGARRLPASLPGDSARPRSSAPGGRCRAGVATAASFRCISRSAK